MNIVAEAASRDEQVLDLQEHRDPTKQTNNALVGSSFESSNLLEPTFDRRVEAANKAANKTNEAAIATASFYNANTSLEQQQKQPKKEGTLADLHHIFKSETNSIEDILKSKNLVNKRATTSQGVNHEEMTKQQSQTVSV